MKLSGTTTSMMFIKRSRSSSSISIQFQAGSRSNFPNELSLEAFESHLIKNIKHVRQAENITKITEKNENCLATVTKKKKKLEQCWSLLKLRWNSVNNFDGKKLSELVKFGIMWTTFRYQFIMCAVWRYKHNSWHFQSALFMRKIRPREYHSLIQFIFELRRAQTELRF